MIPLSDGIPARRFMHGSWDHILGNMLFLAILGKNVGASGAVAREPAAAAS